MPVLRQGDVRGDAYNCLCPHCGKNNAYITKGIVIKLNEIRRFSKPCVYCRKMIFGTAEYIVEVIASKTDFLEELRGPSRQAIEKTNLEKEFRRRRKLQRDGLKSQKSNCCNATIITTLGGVRHKICSKCKKLIYPKLYKRK